MRQKGVGAQLDQQDKVFLSLVEQLARPLLTISHVSELATGEEPSATYADWQMVRRLADSSLCLVESYSLSLRVHGSVTPLAFESMTVASVLYDTVGRLAPLAQQYGVTIELDTGPRAQLIVADRTVLRSAFESLGQVFVAAQAESDERMPIHISAHRSRYGIVAGLYGGTTAFGTDELRRGRTMQGRARQPFPQLTATPAAGVFVADSLLQTLQTKLHAARYRGMTGLAATLRPSYQMQLI